MANLNLSGLYPNLERAYETALIGGFSLQIMFDKEYKNAHKDYPLIKAYYEGVEWKKEGDLIVTLYKPKNKPFTECTKLAALENVAKATLRKDCESFTLSANKLFEVASIRYGFSYAQKELCKNIATSVAKAGASKLVEGNHMAEAINYLTYWDSGIYNAESETLVFGAGIEIRDIPMEDLDIQEAINYLTSLLQK